MIHIKEGTLSPAGSYLAHCCHPADTGTANGPIASILTPEPLKEAAEVVSIIQIDLTINSESRVLVSTKSLTGGNLQRHPQ
jgi:hypothetical protein